jgi:hypothetical protein
VQVTVESILELGESGCEHTFVLRYSYRLQEHDPARPWVVVSIRQMSVDLEDQVQFFTWASDQWPSPRWSVTLDPYQPAAV